jgi:antitoxin component YwqK of YwqJK toxin-antitoxin module
LWQEFYAGFRLKKESYYENGLLDGYYKEYDPQGKLVLTLLYRDGKLIETVTEGRD